MPLNKPILAALAVAAAFAGPAFAQQSSAPADSPPGASQTQRQPDANDPPGDTRRPYWRAEREFRRNDMPGNERWNRRSFDNRDRPGPREGMMRPRGGMGSFCGPQGSRFGDAMIERMERATRPTAEQQPAFDKLKEAAGKAAGIIRAACPAEPSLTPPGRLAAQEKQLAARLEAVRLVRPAMEAYYGSLSDEQKARLYMSRRPMDRMGERTGEPRDGWRGPDQGEPRDGSRQRRSEQRGDHDEDGPRGERGDPMNHDRTDRNTATEPL